MPVAGTIAQGHLPYSIKDENAAEGISNPLPRSAEVLRKGRQNYMTYCSVCHGLLGDGKASLTAAYGAKPANYHAQTIQDLSDGKMFHSMTSGKNAMSSYAAELSPDERWGVVHYIRALQRAYNAREDDIPEGSSR